ncbi:SGNH/GDSL hydrolase family protein [candidate division CSSED10-310 bacterium]|uniref:SGNH/GDSL hydrolase family protein n=1 Tax=candidate division CSSED10-310 bacterium TaxID=2855610 RepID=A0ABV6YS75_UNCC1
MYFKKLIFIMILIIISLLVPEILCRFTFPDFSDETAYIDEKAYPKIINSKVLVDKDSDSYSEKFGYRISPFADETITTDEFQYTVKTNSLGFRAEEIQPKENDEYRVLILGDSMFFGEGVNYEFTVSAQLERLVSQQTRSRKFKTYNFSVGGYNTIQELLVAKTYTDDLQPDHIILGFFIANDVIPNAVGKIDENGNYAFDMIMEQNIKKRLRESFSLFFNSVALRIMALAVFVPKIRYQLAAKTDIMNKSFELVTDLNQFAHNRNIHCSVVIIYPRDAVAGGIIQYWSQSRKVGQLMKNFCQQSNIDVLDLLDVMNGPEDKKKYFYKRDGHFTNAGHAVVAQAISDSFILKHLN